VTETPSVGVLMFVAHRHLEDRIITEARAHGFPATMAQGRLLARIGPDGTRVTDLAAAAQVTKQTAAYLVDQLESIGYVERVPHPDDARARLVRLSARGVEAQGFARTVEARVEAQWRAHLGDQRFDELHATLARLREITDPWLDT
jgi:DNA-binding MarR family transcriptional regulator